MDIIGQIRRIGVKKGADEWELLNTLRDNLASISQYGLRGQGSPANRERLALHIRQAKMDLLLMGAAKEAIPKSDKVMAEWRYPSSERRENVLA